MYTYVYTHMYIYACILTLERKWAPADKVGTLCICIFIHICTYMYLYIYIKIKSSPHCMGGRVVRIRIYIYTHV